MPLYKLYYAYILTSDSGTFYIGATGFLERRIFQHKEKLFEGFTKKYGVHQTSAPLRMIATQPT